MVPHGSLDAHKGADLSLVHKCIFDREARNWALSIGPDLIVRRKYPKRNVSLGQIGLIAEIFEVAFGNVQKGVSMGRSILTRRDVQASAGVAAFRDLAPGGPAGSGAAAPPGPGDQGTKQADEYQDRLIKYIPGDVIAVYLTIAGLVNTANTQVPVATIQWIVFLVLIPGTWLYLWRVAQVTKWQQIMISVIAFIVWVFSLGGPFTQFHWYVPLYGAIVLPLYTFLVPIFEPTK